MNLPDQELDSGRCPRDRSSGIWSLKKPLPMPWSSQTLFEPLSATKRSGTPLPRTFTTAVATGPTPASSRGPARR